jgi:hypothetical protein
MEAMAIEIDGLPINSMAIFYKMFLSSWPFSIENHHVLWVNQLFLWPFSIANS